MNWRSGIYEGWVRHRRFAVTPNAFRYRLFMMYLDLGELDDLFANRWFWSVRRPALARFCRDDHFGDPALPLDQAVRDLVEAQLGRRPRGRIGLLTHLRYFGFVINPVSFFFCYEAGSDHVEAIVLEVQNTPWRERHLYVLDEAHPEKRNRVTVRPSPGAPAQGRGARPEQPVAGCNALTPDPSHGVPGEAGERLRNRFRIAKDLHVSPFLGMDLEYDMVITPPTDRLLVHMACQRADRTELDATLHLRRTEISGASLARVLCQYPAMTLKVAAGIYWQALRLWWKKCPIFPHPQPLSPEGAGRTR